MLHTSGVDRTDHLWMTAALRHGHNVRVFFFDGYRTHVPTGASIQKLSTDELNEAQPFLKMAAERLGKQDGTTFPLLTRYFALSRDAEVLYALGTFESNFFVTGTTGWAVELFKITHPEAPVFLYDLEHNTWHVHIKTWAPIDRPPPPSLFKIWAGVGSRTARDEAVVEAVFKL